MTNGLLRAWEATVRRRAGEIAVTEAAAGRTATFRGLDDGARAWLAAHAPDPSPLAGRAVVFAWPNGIAWLEVLIGLLRAGAVAVPLDAAEPPEVRRRLARSLRAGFLWEGRALVPLAGARRYRGRDVCLVKLTSGSTGEPRPLVFTAAQMLADGRQVSATMGFGPRDKNYALIPFGHSYGLGNLTIPLLAQGIPVVCGTAPLPHAIAGDFARWRPTVFPGVPVIWRALAATGVSLPGLRLGISAGAPLPLEVAREFAGRCGVRLHGFYGSSETGGIAYDRSGLATLRGSVGTALRGVQLTLRRGGRLQVCSAAVVTHGNRRAAGRLGCWLMPDRVARNRRGELTLLGRRDATVKIAGRRVSLAEVAAALRGLAGVREVWVGASDGNEPVLGAVLVANRAADQLRAELQAGTAAWKVPKKLVVVAVLPSTPRGKTDTRALREMVFGPGAA